MAKKYPEGEPPWERRNSCGIFDFYNKRFIIFSGDDYYFHYNDTYILDMGTSEICEWKFMNISKPRIFVISPAIGEVKIRYILPKNRKYESRNF